MKHTLFKSIQCYLAFFMVIVFLAACGSQPKPINKDELRQRANEEVSNLD